jgi:hypothetical protein
MAVTLMSTTSTQDDLNKALGVTPDASKPVETPGRPDVLRASIAELATLKPAGTAAAPAVPPPTAEPAGVAPASIETPTSPVGPVAATPADAPDLADGAVDSDDEPLPADATPQQQGVHTRNRLQKRINELVKKTYTTQGQLDAANAELARLRQQVTPPVAPPALPDHAPSPIALEDATLTHLALVQKYKADPNWPKDEDGDFEDVNAARGAFIADKRNQARDALASQQRQRDAAQAAQAQAKSAFDARVTEFAKAHPDYQTVVNASTVEVSGAMASVLLNPAHDGPALAYYLAQHPDEILRIRTLPVDEQPVAMGELKAKIAAPAAGAAPTASVTSAQPVTKVPPPPQPLHGGTPPAVVESLEDMAKKVTPGSNATSEWIARRNAEIAARRRVGR